MAISTQTMTDRYHWLRDPADLRALQRTGHETLAETSSGGGS
jgi:hypothetical protein